MGAGGREAASPEDGDPAAIACSICLEAVTAGHRDRSTAKLQCGHEFHLDCIGSAFNAKGMMQCPNCRKVEKGSWLYATGVRSLPELSMDGWSYDDLYDLSFSEMAFGIHWCPFDRLSHIPSSFEEGEAPPSIAYQDMFGNFLFTEHPPSYLGLLQQSAPSASRVLPENPLNGASYHHHRRRHHRHWGHMPPPAGVPHHSGPNNDMPFHPWEHHSFRPGLVDGPRPNHDGVTARTMPPLFPPPPAADSSAARAGGVFVSSTTPRLFGGSRGAAPGGHEGFQHRVPPGGRRPAMVLPIGPPPTPPPQSEEAAGFYLFPPAPGAIVGPREAFSASAGSSAVSGRSRHQYGALRQQHPQDHAADSAIAHPQQPYYRAARHFM